MYENIYLNIVEYDVLRLRKKIDCKFQELGLCVVFTLINIETTLSTIKAETLQGDQRGVAH